jgi:hypothetical protein
MSIRRHLRFAQQVGQNSDPTDDDRVAQVYLHSDGYPASVLWDLSQLKELLDATQGMSSGQCVAAAKYVAQRYAVLILNPSKGCGSHRTAREQRMNGNVPTASSESVPVASPAQSHQDTVEYVGFRVDGQAVVLNLSEHRRLSL